MHLLQRMLFQKEIEALEVSVERLQKNGSPATAKIINKNNFINYQLLNINGTTQNLARQNSEGKII